MEDHQYGMGDLRQYMTTTTTTTRPNNLFPPPPPDLLSSHRGHHLQGPPNPYDMLIFRSDSSTSASAGNITAGGVGGGVLSGFESGGGGGDGGGTGRWPRQETLTLLEIRSRLDPKFKEANQKGPLWDEVSRIMSEEHGYQRSGKKCREKFENLYKYYKKTKEGKAGRQDGKHYRFFRQLEALYGDQTNHNTSSSMSEANLVGGNFHYNNFPNNNPSLPYNNNNNQEAYHCPKLSDTSLSLSNYSDSDTTNCSDDSDDPNEDNDQKKKKKIKGKRGWKVKIKDFIDIQMKKLMDKQEAWMDKMVKTIELKEHERTLREEEWRKQDEARIEREQKMWAHERAWIGARDAALMEALHKITGKEMTVLPLENDEGRDIWPECEINRLIQLRSGVEFNNRVSEEAIWDEIARKMACFGHERSGLMCKEKWDSVNNYLLKCNKKRKENYCDTSDQQGIEHHNTIMRLSDHGNSSSDNNNNNSNNNNSGNNITDSCFRYFMSDGY